MDTAQYNRGWRDGATHMLDSVLDFMIDLPETPEIYKVKEFIRNLENGDYEQFEPEMAEDAELVYDMNTGQAEYISMTIKGKEYRLTLTEHKGD